MKVENIYIGSNPAPEGMKQMRNVSNLRGLWRPTNVFFEGELSEDIIINCKASQTVKFYRIEKV